MIHQHSTGSNRGTLRFAVVGVLLVLASTASGAQEPATSQATGSPGFVRGVTQSAAQGGAITGSVPLSPSLAASRPSRPRARAQGQEDAVNGPAQALGGRVVSGVDQHPIAGATVQLTGQRTNREVASTRTDAEGRYSFPPEPAGKYHLRASAPDYRGQLYLEHDGYSASIVLGQGLPTASLDFQLIPGASLHGRITDESGDAPQRAQVQLFRILPPSLLVEPQGDVAPRVQRMRGTQADDEGRYDFDDLQAGQYYVAVTAQPWYAVHPPAESDRGEVNYRVSVDPALDVVYPETFYPGATSDDGARPITLHEGERVAANISLVPQHAFRLQLQDAGDGGRGVPVLSHTVFGMEEGVPNVNVEFQGSNHAVTMTGLAAGTYQVSQANGRGPASAQTTVVLGGSSSAALNLGTGQVGGDLKVHVRALDGAPLPDGMTLQAFRESERGGNPGVSVQAGAAGFSGLTPGAYRLMAQAAGERWAVVRVSRDGRPLPSRLVQVDSGRALSVDLLVSRYAPSVHGVVRGAGGRPEPGAMAVLVPAGNDGSRALYRRDETDLDGSYNFAEVVPGNYLLIAVRNAWSLPWTDAAALAPYLMKATPVVVPASGPGTQEVREGAVVQPLH